MKFKLHGTLTISSALLIIGAASAVQTPADTPPSNPLPTRRQMMKECMAKQKASNAGLTREQMKKNCRDVTENERENAKANQESAAHTAGTPPSP